MKFRIKGHTPRSRTFGFVPDKLMTLELTLSQREKSSVVKGKSVAIAFDNQIVIDRIAIK